MKIESVRSNSLSRKEREEIAEKTKLPKTNTGILSTVNPEAEKPLEMIKTKEEKLLEQTKITPDNIEPLEGDETEVGTNINFTVGLEDGSRGFLKLFHPDQEIISHPEPEKIEVANYAVSRIMGFNLVPATVTKEIATRGLEHTKAEEDGRSLSEIFGRMATGSFSFFIEDAWPLAERMDNDVSKEQLLKLYVFDYITANWDRHDNNVLITKDGKIHAIDNSGSFFDLDREAGNSLKQGLEKVAEERIPQKLHDLLLDFRTNKPKRELLRRELSKALPEEHIAACFSRIHQITELALNDDVLSEEDIGRLKIR